MGDIRPPDAPIRLLVINPNTSVAMTDALKPMIEKLGYENLECTFFTCPTPGIPSINSPADAEASAKYCLPHLLPLLPDHDAYLVACFSQHPLVPMLKEENLKLSPKPKPVLGILEASVLTSLGLLAGSPSSLKFGIVSTGAIWGTALVTAVEEFLNTVSHYRSGGGKFMSCETTGLSAVELHDLPAEQVRDRMRDAAARLARWGCQEKHYDRRLGVVVLGCAGMTGLEAAVKEGLVLVMGEEAAEGVRIVDGVRAGVGMLVALCRGRF